jgi:hypothetical protein
LCVALAGALGFLSVAAASCSSSDTVLALTIESGKGVVEVSKVRVTITPASGSAITSEYDPPTTDGAIVTSFFERITLPESADGEAIVRADALDAGGNSYAWDVTNADIQKGHTVAAHVTLMVGGPPPPDGGAGGAGGGGEGGAGGSGGGAAGAAGSGVAGGGAGSGGEGGGAGSAGSHAGAGGRAGHPGGVGGRAGAGG